MIKIEKYVGRLKPRKEVVSSIAVIMMIFSTVFAGCIGGPEHTIRISGAWALYPLMLVWADEYEREHDVKIEVSGGGAGKGVSDTLNGQVDMGMISRPPRDEEIEQGMFYIAVVKDSVVATINKDNPVLDEIYEQGLSREDLRKIFMKEVTHWGDIVNKSVEDDKIVVYGRSDASGAAKVWASFLGNYTQSDLQNKADANFDGDMNLATGLHREKNAIGFNNLNYAYNIETGGFAEAIRPVPLDLDGNGKLDQNESFYNNREQFVENVSEGNYPSPPARKDYVVSKGPFKGKTKDFVRWILTDGQAFVKENGYVQLSDELLEKEIEYLEKGNRG
jgi:phosphate transport system substrate-binding protein